MKKTYCCFFFLIVSLSIISCRQTKASDDIPVITVHFDGRGINTPMHLSHIIDSVRRVQISDEVVLKTPVKVRYACNRYYIADKGNHSIVILDEEGHLVGTINRRGRSHDEYVTLKNYEINPSNGVISIYDESSHRLLFFSPEGDYLKTIELDRTMGIYRGFILLENSDYLAYYPDYSSRGSDYKRGLWLMDSSGCFKQQLLALDDNYKYHQGRVHDYFCRLEDGSISLIGEEDNNYIYQISADGTDIHVSAKIQFDKPMSSDVLQNIPTPETGEHLQYSKYWYAETDRWIFINCLRVHPSGNALVVYDKHENKEYLCLNPDDIIEDLFAPVLTGTPAENRLISLYYDENNNHLNPEIIVAYLKR